MTSSAKACYALSSLVPQPTCCWKWLFPSQMGTLSMHCLVLHLFYDMFDRGICIVTFWLHSWDFSLLCIFEFGLKFPVTHKPWGWYPCKINFVVRRFLIPFEMQLPILPNMKRITFKQWITIFQCLWCYCGRGQMQLLMSGFSKITVLSGENVLQNIFLPSALSKWLQMEWV